MIYYKKLTSIFLLLLASMVIITSCDENVTDTNDDDNNNNPINNEHSGTITTDETWAANTVHNVQNCLNIDGATLTIEEGATVVFNSNGCLRVRDGGALMVNGTETSPVTFTGEDKQPGYWRYIYFQDGASSASTISNAVVEYAGGYADYSGAIVLAGSSPAIENTIIRNSESHGIVMDDHESMPTLENNTITSSGGSPIFAHVDNVHTIGDGDYSGNTNNFILVKGGTLENDATWGNRNAPYRIDNNQIVKVKNATLTIDPGTTIEMGSSARFEMEQAGALNAQGTVAEPINITGAVKQNGYWRYIWLSDGSSNSTTFDHVNIEYGGGYADDYGMIHIRNTSPTITNSTIRNSGGFGIWMDSGSMPELNNNVITANSNAPISADFANIHKIGTGDYTGNNNNKDYIYVDQGKIDNNVTLLKQNVPYRFSNRNIIENATLTVQPGTVIEMDSEARIEIGSGGAMNAIGTPAEKIHIKGALPQKGYWRHISIGDGSNNAGNVFDNTIVEHGGGYDDDYGNIYIRESSPTIRNSTIRNSESWGIYVRDNSSQPILENNIYENNDGGDEYWPE